MRLTSLLACCKNALSTETGEILSNLTNAFEGLKSQIFLSLRAKKLKQLHVLSQLLIRRNSKEIFLKLCSILRLILRHFLLPFRMQPRIL